MEAICGSVALLALMSAEQGGFLEDLPDDVLGADPVADLLGARAPPEGPQAVDLAAWASFGRASAAGVPRVLAPHGPMGLGGLSAYGTMWSALQVVLVYTKSL